MQDANMEASMVRAAAEAGDYERAVVIASHLVPEMTAQLGQYQVQMALYEEARAAGNWRLAIRALADARLAAIAAGLPELEGVATDRLYTVVKSYELRRA